MALTRDETRDDLEALRQIAKRDAQAFAAFYDRHAPKIFAILVRIVQDRSEAEDALQEVFWQVWREADTYNVMRGSPQAWLVQIARSRGIDLLRKMKLRSQRQVEFQNDLPDRGADHAPDVKIAKQDTQRKIRQIMNALPAEQRQTLILAFFNDMTHQEIATQLGLALGTIKTRIRLGLDKLYDAFQQNGVLP